LSRLRGFDLPFNAWDDGGLGLMGREDRHQNRHLPAGLKSAPIGTITPSPVRLQAGLAGHRCLSAPSAPP
jgi:hypothetical protein